MKQLGVSSARQGGGKRWRAYHPVWARSLAESVKRWGHESETHNKITRAQALIALLRTCNGLEKSGIKPPKSAVSAARSC
jgi:hypothetical protein